VLDECVNERARGAVTDSLGQPRQTLVQQVVPSHEGAKDVSRAALVGRDVALVAKTGEKRQNCVVGKAPSTAAERVRDVANRARPAAPEDLEDR
jgi:hypothetical protein